MSGRRNGWRYPHRWSPRTRWWRSLRGRVTVAFGGVALVLAVVMGTSVLLGVSQYLTVQRQERTVAQTTANALRLERGLVAGLDPVPELLAELRRGSGSMSFLRYSDEWFTSSLVGDSDQLPPALVRNVLGGQPSRQRVVMDGTLRLVIGVPLENGSGAYFEVFTIEELDRNVEALAIALGIAALGAPVLGMLLGRWAASRALRPLHTLSAAASAVASGDLGARVHPGDDPDLAGLADSFNDNAEALERRVRRDARFAADVSHELSSPLTTIVGAMDLLHDGRDRLPAPAAEALDLLREEVHRFERLVADLLEISRGDAGGAGLVLEEVRLADLVARSLPSHRRGALRVVPPAEQAMVRVDKRRMERVVANLVDNAERHAGGLTGVTVDVAGEDARVLVDDAGPGVPDAQRDRIFERFTRVGPGSRAKTEGAGLGLALVGRHLKLVDGAVEVGRSPQDGARFTVRLPLHRSP